jgi:hypothetical protein
MHRGRQSCMHSQPLSMTMGTLGVGLSLGRGRCCKHNVCYLLLLTTLITSSHPRPAHLTPRSCAEPSISTPSPTGYSQAKRDVPQLPPAAVARSDHEWGAHIVHSGGCFPAIQGGPLVFAGDLHRSSAVCLKCTQFSHPSRGRADAHINKTQYST